MLLGALPVQGGSQAHYLLGLRILNMLVSEMNSPTAGRSLTQHRKIAVNFRRGGGPPTLPRLSSGVLLAARPAAFSCIRQELALMVVWPCVCVCMCASLPCRDQSLYKVFQLALTALRHLQGTAADDKLKEQVCSRLAAPTSAAESSCESPTGSAPEADSVPSRQQLGSLEPGCMRLRALRLVRGARLPLAAPHASPAYRMPSCESQWAALGASTERPHALMCPLPALAAGGPAGAAVPVL